MCATSSQYLLWGAFEALGHIAPKNEQVVVFFVVVVEFRFVKSSSNIERYSQWYILNGTRSELRRYLSLCQINLATGKAHVFKPRRKVRNSGENILFKMSDRDKPTTPQEVRMIQIPVNLAMSSPLVMIGILTTNWKRFYRAWNNYEIAARLKDSCRPDIN